jgi:hypothetical protein
LGYLQVCGKWFKQSDTQKDIWHFLVYFIESCSHPLPYKKLLWGIEDETEANYTKTDKNTLWITQIKPEKQEEREVGSDSEPMLQAIFSEAVFDGRKFSDLDTKEKEERLISEVTQSGKIYRIVTIKSDKTRDSETQGFKVKINEKELSVDNSEKPTRLPAGWKLFNDILTKLRENISIKTRVVNFDTGNEERPANSMCSYFPHTVLRKRTSSWAFLDKDQTERRQAMLAEITKDDKFVYLFDIEVNPNNQNDRYSMLLVKNENHLLRLDVSFWKQIFDDCVKNRGIKRNLWKLGKSKTLSIRHDKIDPSKYASEIVEFF